MEKKYQHQGPVVRSAKLSFSSYSSWWLLSGTSPPDEVHSGPASLCIPIYVLDFMSRFYIWHCNKFLVEKESCLEMHALRSFLGKGRCLGLLGNQLCSLHKLWQCSINLDFGLLAFSRSQISFKDVACILCSYLSWFFSTFTEKWPNGRLLEAYSIISVCIKYNLETLTQH